VQIAYDTSYQTLQLVQARPNKPFPAKLWITTPKASINILYSYLKADVLEADISRLLGAVAVWGSIKTRELTEIFNMKKKT